MIKQLKYAGGKIYFGGKIIDKKDELTSIKGIYPSYHMNKQKWISVVLDEALEDEYILSLVDISRNLVASKKKK